MSGGAVVRSFAKRHSLVLTPILRSLSVPIRSLANAMSACDDAYSKLDEKALSDPAIGILLTMLHRNFEHAEAAIVTFSTGNGSSAEVVARAASEASVVILYILAGDRVARMRAHLEHYFSGVDDQVRRWKCEIEKLPREAMDLHDRCAEQRKNSNNAMRTAMRRVLGAPTESWPKQVAARFDQVGLGIDYRTVYARLGSETHADAEETVRFVLGKIHGDSKVLEAMALETTYFSLYLVHYSVLLFLQAARAYATSYALTGCVDIIAKAVSNVESEILKLIPLMGAGA